MDASLEIFKYLCLIAIGFIAGRITMAIQYVIMKPKGKEPENMRILA
jgi:hypothetical protein